VRIKYLSSEFCINQNAISHYFREKLAELVKKSIAVLDEARSKYETEDSPMVLSGNIGPRGDGYKIGDSKMSVEEAFEYHEDQISTFAQGTNADQVMGATLNYPEEAIGIVKAAQKYRIPSIISFTVEKTDAKLPCGLTLAVKKP
jgi:homocysteine S-methyltransferase